MAGFNQHIDNEYLIRHYPNNHIGITDMQEDPLGRTHENLVANSMVRSNNARGFRDKILEKLGNA